jgi:hypothetical protein
MEGNFAEILAGDGAGAGGENFKIESSTLEEEWFGGGDE